MGLEVIAPGTSVELSAAPRVYAVVTRVAIYEQNHVQYEVAWWNGLDRKTAWVESCEIVATGSSKLPVGFHSKGQHVGAEVK
jgi:hypothetical protein